MPSDAATIQITLPDGTTQAFPSGTTAHDVALSIGEKLAEAAIGAKVNGALVDVHRILLSEGQRPLEELDGWVTESQSEAVLSPSNNLEGIALEIVTMPRLNKQGRSKWRDEQHEKDALYLLRHSCAHIMAEAIQNLYPEARLAYGPPLEHGFYYDIALDTPISSDDFSKIEDEMRRLLKHDREFIRYDLDVEAGLRRLKHEGNKYKIDNAERAIDRCAKSISFYMTGDDDESLLDAGQPWFEDLCQGPHVDRTSRIGAFKVTSIASSHWHGDVNSDRFQRVYGTAFFTQADLDAHLEQLEQAKQRDHRVVGQKLGLFAI
ncbi:MAG: TGS domain-containing protein, partial [Planctomycetota bacterium]